MEEDVSSPSGLVARDCLPGQALPSPALPSPACLATPDLTPPLKLRGGKSVRSRLGQLR
jgi:hypothetical protein